MPNTTQTQNSYADSQKPIYVNTKEGAGIALQMISDAIKNNNLYDLALIVERLQEMLRPQWDSLKEKIPELADQYKREIARAQWHILNRLQPDEIALLFRDHIEYIFEYTLDEVQAALRVVLMVESSREVRDRMKQQWRDALNQSQVHIGEAKINVTGVLMDPTLANWLRDWREFLGQRTPDSLMIVEYLNSSENIRSVVPQVREKLSLLLKFIIWLMKSSLTPEGYENRVMVPDPYTGTYKTLNYGKMDDSGVAVPPDQLKEVRAEYLLDENGKPLPLAERVKRLTGFNELVAEAKAKQQAGMKKAVTQPTQQPVVKAAEVKPVVVMPAPVKPAVSTPVTPSMVTRSTPGLPPVMPLVMPKVVVPQTPVVMPQVKAPVPTVPTPVAPKPVAPMPQPTKQKDDPREMAERVLGEHKILFASIDLEKRFLSILTSYFSGVRDRMETRETLLRVPQEGGVNLSAAKADEILATAEEVLAGKSSLPKLALPKKAVQAPVFKPRLEDMMKMAEQHKKHEPAAPVEVEDILSTVNPIFESQQVMQPSASFSSIAALNRPQKKVMQDITPSAGAAPRVAPVMGPLDELRALTADEFRRISPDPQAAAQHVYDKVQLLEMESVEKKAEGIRSWQQSPINQLYIEIGNECLEKSVAVGDVILQRTNAHRPTLTQDEFTAVSDLNRHLRF